MLQEESVKRLSYLMHKAFSRAHLSEFIGRIDMKVDAIEQQEKQLASSIQDGLNNRQQKQSQDIYNQRLQQMNQAPRQQPGNNPNGGNFPQFSDHRQQNVPNNFDFNNHNNQSINNLMQKKDQNFSSATKSGQQHHDDSQAQYMRGVTAISAIQGGRSSQPDMSFIQPKPIGMENDSILDPSPTMTQTAALNKLKTLDSSIDHSHHKLNRLNTEFNAHDKQNQQNFKPNGSQSQNPNVQMMQQQQQQSQNMAGQEAPEKEIKVEYLCYGDLIMLNFSKKIFKADIDELNDVNSQEVWDGESMDEAQQQLMDDQHRKEQTKLQRLIVKPLYMYKGMIYSDGILDKDLKIIPKQSEENTINAKCQFKKCLFRVEIFDNCTFHMLHRKQVQKVKEIKEHREHVLAQNDYQKVAIIDKEIADQEETLKRLKNEMKLETSSNKEVQDDHFGQKVQYGDRVLLRHIFTNQLLRIEPTLVSDQEGMVQVMLGELADKSIVSFIPAQDIKQIASELKIYNSGLSKFNLQVGGQINIQDSFFLLNREMGANYYATVDDKPASTYGGFYKNLGFNAGLHPTHLRANLFLAADKNIIEKLESTNKDSKNDAKHSEIIFSGDTVRLKNQETQCYLQRQGNQIGNRSIVNPMPFFLKRQIQRLRDLPEDYDQVKEKEGLFDQDADDFQVEDQKEQDQQNEIGMDSDPRWQSITNSCWEIQQVKSLKGSHVQYDGMYRFKHIATEKYLSLDHEGRVNLVLKSRSPIQFADTLFLLRNVNQEQAFLDDDDEIDGQEVYHKSKFYIETAFNTFLQLYQKIPDEAERIYNYVDNSKFDFYQKLRSDSMVSVVAGAKQLTCEEGEPKMVFEIERVPKEESSMAFKSLGFTTAVRMFYNFLNDWGVGEAPVGINHIDNLCFSNVVTIKDESLLKDEVLKLEQMLQDIKEILTSTYGESKKQFKIMQRELQEHFLIELLAYNLELIYYKTMPEEFREKPFKPDYLKAHLGQDSKLESDDHVAFQIARENLDHLNAEILEIIYLMITDDEINSERLTQFVDILKLQFQRSDKQFVCKLFCHMYKMSKFIFNDRSSVILSQYGISQKPPSQFTSVSQISKWMNLFETINYRDENDTNIPMQIIYIKIVGSFLRNKQFQKPELHQQVQVISRLVYDQTKSLLWFGYNRQANKLRRPFVFFPRLLNESSDKFLQSNPYLQQVCSQGNTLDGQKRFDIIFDLSEMTQASFHEPKAFEHYFKYIKTIMSLYESMCTGRNAHAIQAMRTSFGISNNTILTVIESEHRQKMQIHQILKDAFLRFVRIFIYDNLPYNEWPNKDEPQTHIMCYFWEDLAKAQPHKTVYGWEKQKYGEDLGAGFGVTEQECDDTNDKIRQVLLEYFEFPILEVGEFFYESEGKTYKPNQINPLLQQMIDRFRLAQAIYWADCADSHFNSKIIESIMHVIACFSYQQLLHSFKDQWIYKVIRVAKNIERCEYKLKKLILLSLQLLDQICQMRLSEQALQTLKVFKEFETETDISFVGFNGTLIEPKFKRLLQMMQFNPSYEVQSLTRMLIMMDPQLPVFDESQRERVFFERKRETLKELAVKSQLARKIIKAKGKPISPEDLEFEDLSTDHYEEGNMSPVREDRGHKVEIEMAQVKPSSKTELLGANNETLADENDNEQMTMGYAKYIPVTESKQIAALWKNMQPLEEFMLYFVFSDEANEEIPETAMSIISQNMSQRENLLQLVSQVQILVSQEDCDLYLKFKYYRDRLEVLINRLMSDELTFLIYKVIQKVQMAEVYRDLIKVVRRLTNMLKESHGLRLRRMQAMLRQIRIDYFLIRFIKNIYYDSKFHESTFQQILELLFHYCLNNTVNQLSMKQFIPYLVDLAMKMDLQTGPLLGQIISSERLLSNGQKFVQFIVTKIVEQNVQKAQIYKLLTFLVQNTKELKILVLTQVITNPVFRHKLYLSKKNVSVKIERVKELNRRVLILQHTQTNILTKTKIDDSVYENYEGIKLHIAVCDLMAMCSVDIVYAIRQIRRIVDLDCLLDSLMAQAVPYILKKSYLRLLFNGFIQEVDDVHMFDLHFPKFLSLMRNVVLHDIEHYFQYFAGLAVPNPELDERDAIEEHENAILRDKVKADLQRVSDDLFDKINEHKNYKQKLEEKEFMLGLSPLNQNRVIQFLDSNNKAEYWEYFCSYDVQLRRNDGLVYFVRDFYRATASKVNEWSEELVEITERLKASILEIIDKLDRLKETYLDNLIDLDNVQFALDEAINAIPNTKNLRNKQQFAREDQEDGQKEEEEEFGPDVEERIMRICRDNIIASNQTIRETFKIESKAADILVNPYFIKKRMKDVLGFDVTYREISWFIEKSIKQLDKKLKLKGVMGQEIGMPGYVRSRYQTMILQRDKAITNAEVEIQLYNFKELETMIRSVLTKSGYKQALIIREEALEDEQFEAMDGPSLQIGVQSDLQHFMKLFQEFLLKYEDSDQVNDLAQKLLQRFNKVFIEANRQLGACTDEETAGELFKMFEYRLLTTQLSRLVLYIKPYQVETQHIQNKKIMLKLLCSMLKLMNPDKVEMQVRQVVSNRRKIMQNLMTSVGILKKALESVNQEEDSTIVDLSIQLLNLLGMENNFVLNQIKAMLQEQVYGFSYFKMLEQKIIYSTSEIIKQGMTGSQDEPPVDQDGKLFNLEKESRKREQTVKDVLVNNFEEPFINRNNQLQQPIFYPIIFSLEEQHSQIKPSLGDTLLPLLTMLQLQIDSECGIETILVQQAANNKKNVNLVKTLAYSFIDITRILKERIFTQFLLIEVLQQLLITLIKVLESELSTDIKIQFAQWDLLLRQVNWLLELDFSYFNVDKVEARFKLRLLHVGLQFLRTLMSHTDKDIQTEIASLIVKFLNKQNLRNKLLDIFKAKIGGTAHREKIFKTRAYCTHATDEVQMKRTNCQFNEHCFYENLVPFDQLTIDCAEDLFMILYILNKKLPKYKLDEIKFDHNVTGYFFQQNLKSMLPQLHFEAFNQISDQATRLSKTIAETHKIKTLTGEEQKGMEGHEVNQILEQVFIQYAAQKYLDSVKQRREDIVTVRTQQHTVSLDKFIQSGIDDLDRLILAPRTISADTDIFGAKKDDRNPFYVEELENKEWDEIFLNLLQEKQSSGIFRKIKSVCCHKPNAESSKVKKVLQFLCCFSWCSRFSKTNGLTPREKAKALIAIRQYLTSKSDLERVQQYFVKREQQIQLERSFVGPFFGNYTRQILQNQVYVFDQFKYEYAFQFLLETMSQVQILLDDGTVVTETFIVPHYVRFMTDATKDSISKKSRWEILENLAVIRVEMLSLQAMKRFSPFLLWLVSKYTWSLQLSYSLTFWQNAIILMTYTREKLLQPFTQDMITGRVDLKQNDGDSWIDYSLEIMSMSNMQSLFFSLWSYQILYFSVLEFKMKSDKQTNWLTGMCKRKPKNESQAIKGSLHDMTLDPQSMKTDPTQNFNDDKIDQRLIQDEELLDSSKTMQRRLTEIPSMMTRPGSSAQSGNKCLWILSKISVFLRAPLHDQFQLQLLIFQAVSFFAIWLDWWNLTIMLLHLFIRVPFFNALLQVFKKSFRNILRLVFLGFIMLYALSYVRLLAAFKFDTVGDNMQDDNQMTNVTMANNTEPLSTKTSSTRKLSNHTDEIEIEIEDTAQDDSTEEISMTLLEAMQQVIGVKFERDAENTFTILDAQIPGSFIQEIAQTIVVALFFLFVGMFIGTILGANIGKGEVKLEDIKCQVCDVTRANYDAKKLTQMDWDNHIKRDHNIYAYVYYMLKCCEGSAVDKRRMTRTQKYVRRKLIDADLSWMPIYNEGDQ